MREKSYKIMKKGSCRPSFAHNTLIRKTKPFIEKWRKGSQPLKEKASKNSFKQNGSISLGEVKYIILIHSIYSFSKKYLLMATKSLPHPCEENLNPIPIVPPREVLPIELTHTHSSKVLQTHLFPRKLSYFFFYISPIAVLSLHISIKFNPFSCFGIIQHLH